MQPKFAKALIVLCAIQVEAPYLTLKIKHFRVKLTISYLSLKKKESEKETQF